VELFWVESPAAGRLAVATRPRGGDWLGDDIAAAVRVGVTVVVSALEEREAQELGLAGEREACSAAGIRFVSIQVPDRSIPGLAAAANVREIARLVEAGEAVAIHCRQALGRAPMLAAATLVALGATSEQAWQGVQSARGQVVPETEQQRAWPGALSGRSAH
jgi:protein-tyrosine phosphatase